jgi:hypothetical protein
MSQPPFSPYIDAAENTLVLYGVSVPLDGIDHESHLARRIATALGAHAVGSLIKYGERTLRVSGPPWKVEAIS